MVQHQKDAGKYLNPDIADNFSRGLPPEVLANINWYPTVPVGLEEMEGKQWIESRLQNKLIKQAVFSLPAYSIIINNKWKVFRCRLRYL